MVDESPLTAKLQPKEHHPEDNSCHRRRICVVCGEEEKNFIHKHVIPLEYRKLVYSMYSRISEFLNDTSDCSIRVFLTFQLQVYITDVNLFPPHCVYLRCL